MKQENSIKLHERAKKVIPGGAQTLSKYYGRVPQGVAPAFISHGDGCTITDVDGNTYIDWSASLGPVIIGHGTIKPSTHNVLLPMSHISEITLAEKLIDIIPCAEMVRFFKDGSSATTAAVRLARAITKKDQVICCGYHGWHDWYVSTLDSPKRNGTQPLSSTTKIEYGNLDILERQLKWHDVACFILEPMSRQCPEKANTEYLQEVRELCSKHDVILIFDEIIMGFRYAMAGGQEYFGVTPDLACYSKAMANGYPIAALVGKRDLMEELQYLQVSGTYFGELQSISAALETIDFMERNNVIENINQKAKNMFSDLDNMMFEYDLEDTLYLKGRIEGSYGPWSSFVWSDGYEDEEQLFLETIFKNGIFYNRDHFMMFHHTLVDIDETLRVYRLAFRFVKRCIEEGTVQSKLEGKMDRASFSR